MNTPHLRRASLAAAVLASLGTTCGENGLNSDFLQRVGVAAGDFDDVAAPLKRGDIAHDVYEGLISTATWDETFTSGSVALKVEDLFISSTGAGAMGQYQAVFVASGTRGFGARQYNGLDPDDSLVQDTRVADNVRRYVSRGNTLLVTDWAYELIETAWPDAIDWVGPEPSQVDGSWIDLDGAQRGQITRITASVVDPTLADALGGSTMAVDFPYSNYAVIDAVGANTTVYVTGDVSYRPDLTADPIALTDVPLLVGFTPPGGGTVLFSAFHLDAQNPALVDQLITTLVGTFQQENTNVSVQ